MELYPYSPIYRHGVYRDSFSLVLFWHFLFRLVQYSACTHTHTYISSLVLCLCLLIHTQRNTRGYICVCVCVYVCARARTVLHQKEQKMPEQSQRKAVPVYAMTANWGVGVQLHSLLISALDAIEWSASRSGCFTLRDTDKSTY